MTVFSYKRGEILSTQDERNRKAKATRARNKRKKAEKDEEIAELKRKLAVERAKNSERKALIKQGWGPKRQ